MKSEKKNNEIQRMINIGLVAAIFIAGIVLTRFWGGSDEESCLVFHEEGYFTIQDAQGTSTDVYYVDVVSAEYVEDADFGEADGGAVADGYRLGSWKSEEFGEYINCTDEELTSCVLIRTQEAVYAISSESDSTTQSLQKAILKARDQLLESE